MYLDGANLNALMGSASPGRFGADVSHLNLHKTFCIPHGGGGPGRRAGGGEGAPRAVPARASAAPRRRSVRWPPRRSAVPASCPISWAFIALMGGRGLTAAARVAVLNANYVAQRLAPHFPILYTGESGGVAHECIVDPRPLKDATGVTAEDIAKRLIDFGIHAPTMSFPVAGTLMIEPTESEDKRELDRFVDAMIAIRAEIARDRARALAAGRQPAQARPAHRARGVRRTSGRTRTRARAPPTRSRRSAPRSTGRRSGGWTTCTATGTSCARVRR